MKKILLVLLVSCLFVQCKNKQAAGSASDNNKELANVLEQYFDEKMQLFPLEATINGDNRFNNLLPADFTDSYRSKLKDFYTKNTAAIKTISRDSLNENDKISYDIFTYEMHMALEGLSFKTNYQPFDQFNAVPLMLGQMGGGTGNQPFKTVVDYDNWLGRAAAFSNWTDSAIVYFKKGIAVKYVLPKALVVKMIPQLQFIVSDSATVSIFYLPIKNMPATFSDSDKIRLTGLYTTLIQKQLVPAYKKLYTFLQTEYLPAARTTTGVNALPDGEAYYNYQVKYWTTTSKTPTAIYNTGLSEVKRIRTIMDSIKNAVHFTGDLNAFFEFMKTDKRFMPYKNAEEILNAFRKIQERIEPNLKNIFIKTPKTKFEIRQTEAFRAASASAEYYQGLVDGSRPGIFYVPIIDATKFNTL